MSLPADRPYAPACDENRDAILAVLARHWSAPGTVLEIGAGTGQHALYFATRLRHLRWQATDVAVRLPGIAQWLADAPPPALPAPLALDVTQATWPLARADYAFSANTAHILGWPQLAALFDGLGRVLADGGSFCLYGPFARDGRHIAPSNARFDAALRRQDPAMGVRDTADLARVAAAAGLDLDTVEPMPRDNLVLVWRRRAAT